MTIGTEFSDMAADVQGAFSASMTLRRVLTKALSTTTGKRTETTVDYTVAMERGQTVDDFDAGGSRVKARTFTMRADAVLLSDNTNYTPDREDYVIDGTSTWRVVKRPALVNGSLLKLFCHEWNGRE